MEEEEDQGGNAREGRGAEGETTKERLKRVGELGNNNKNVWRCCGLLMLGSSVVKRFGLFRLICVVIQIQNRLEVAPSRGIKFNSSLT